MTVLSIKFYSTEEGNEPVRDWLKSLSKEKRKTIGGDIRAVQETWPVGMPLVRKMDRNLWEVRTSTDDGIARTFFTVRDGRMYLVHGIVKKSAKTPLDALDLAKKRRNRVHC